MGQAGSLRPTVSRPLTAFASSQVGRLTIGRRLPACPTLAHPNSTTSGVRRLFSTPGPRRNPSIIMTTMTALPGTAVKPSKPLGLGGLLFSHLVRLYLTAMASVSTNRGSQGAQIPACPIRRLKQRGHSTLRRGTLRAALAQKADAYFAQTAPVGCIIDTGPKPKRSHGLVAVTI